MIALLKHATARLLLGTSQLTRRSAERLLPASAPRLPALDIDVLTGVGTHRAALAEIDRLIDARRPFSLIRLSVNNIKAINERLGHAIGDELLVSLARRLQQLSLHDGRVYRLGGDEFLMITEATLGNDRWRETIDQPLELEGTSLIPSLSVSDLRYPEHGQESRHLLRRSGIALSLARQSHDGYHAYECGLDRLHERERQLLRDMVMAVREQQLRVVYQPKIRIRDGSVTGFEALMQWQHPQLGLLQPDEFLPLAAASGHMTLLGEWLLQHVIAQMAEWQARQNPQTIAVNLSALNLERTGFGTLVSAWLADRGVDPHQLMVEITEQSMMHDPELTARGLAEWRRQGIQIAIDDFGTGYSSLTQLRQLPLDVLKIDKSFVMGMLEQPEDAMIVDASIALAHRFGLSVIAEGVETSQHLNRLAAAGCDQAQGYLISSGLEADAVLAWLDRYRESPLLATPA
ncbi:bifunctional diguanylate cyclase/phosphodiesterase [Modicisalibacter tunisiensis]|uniref:putative bifunctional diguanylate cyclase/phosphodiesterase n=1 Tax=Modicisalibacter TaxID=574347 RepID=UPI00079CC7C1|nr:MULTISPECIES: bifunctional diguanylate cyclase/phosphodiesterase [Modicisalibacter]KXS39409.1 MAG: hypothetical protein AWU55_391 [Halomonadaceae bacterium T82-2]MBZ9537947.1 bifunctional diguanylate cyclase/phosphodiesterase [Modicisalibacter tunisiensis]